ncbi:hypothetical protein GH714_035934 [Hevea brasiliensis]|uniref:non-specific serine/threonine protein kinase n=1 Tax=Hevea brasiliensis TaxID=3981 RepID=A0A6A6KF62_HEVBR|nr:hypothetical protein GH714_035934 [Hevea brasiliensis]
MSTSTHTVHVKPRRRSVTSAPPPAASPSHPSTSLPPLSTPLTPKATTPGPLPTAQAPSPPPSVRSRPPTNVLPPARPNHRPPSAFPLLPPTAPSSSVKSPPLLSLPFQNGSLPVSSKQSHLSMGLKDGCDIGGVFLLLVLVLICICNKYRRGRKDSTPDAEHYHRTASLEPKGIGQPVLEWATRLKIAIRSAKGLAYLHEDCNPTIVHCDIKAANILLDHKFEAKVSDFGLAKSFSDTRSIISHTCTQVVGTFGYLAPEYASSARVTEKLDVYSYGIMLLELITRRPPISDINSVKREALDSWALAQPIFRIWQFRDVVDPRFMARCFDPRLENNYNTSEMASMVACAVACAAACVRHSSWLRPRMSQIVRALEGDISAMDLYEGTRPGHSTFYGSASSFYDNFQYKQDIKKHNMELATWRMAPVRTVEPPVSMVLTHLAQVVILAADKLPHRCTTTTKTMIMLGF